MDSNNSTTKIRPYKHLSFKQRVYIEIRLKDGVKPCGIAKELCRAKNTILNEVRRGTVPQKKQGKVINVYLADAGQAIYDNNRKSSRPSLKIAKCHHFIKYVIKNFKDKGMIFRKKFNLILQFLYNLFKLKILRQFFTTFWAKFKFTTYFFATIWAEVYFFSVRNIHVII
ncbi:helix-turn-helix domain-containing protein [Criibacterium bergeronii]|uniref:Helix-turn-helix domain-containing protein n=1 Tax=Criibacterium bergeronii TaxID=1871336 RepID=A0A552VD67_9FIRM|nr:helix-turn-helix domain-containing protein [Criibacterium bergeronii]